MYVENFVTRSAAMKRELEIKRKKSRKYIEKLIESGERPDTPEVWREGHRFRARGASAFG